MKQGWEIKMLKEIGFAQTGTTPKTADKDNYGDFIPFIKPADIDINNDGEIRYDNDGLSEKGLQAGRKMCEGSILMVCIGATIGKVGFVDRDVSCNQQINSLTVQKEFHPKFVYYAISTPNFYQQVIKSSAQATLPIINKGKWESLRISYPKSFPEQQRIVAILDEAFAAIAKAKANAEQNLKNAKELFESYLQGVFENPKDNWEVCNLETYIKLIDYRGRTPVKTESGVRLITAKNVKLGFLQLEPQEFIAQNNYESWMSRGIPNFGDVIFTTEAPLANVAQIDTTEKLAFAQRIIVMQPKPSKLNQNFLKYMLLSNPIRNKILGKGTGATVLGIKSSLLKKIEIYFPKSIKEQQTIVQKLDALSSEIKKLEAIYQQKIKDLEELKKSVLQKAFSGQLKTALA